MVKLHLHPLQKIGQPHRNNSWEQCTFKYLLGKCDDFWQKVDFQFQHISSATSSSSGTFNGEDSTRNSKISLLHLFAQGKYTCSTKYELGKNFTSTSENRKPWNFYFPSLSLVIHSHSFINFLNHLLINLVSHIVISQSSFIHCTTYHFHL